MALQRYGAWDELPESSIGEWVRLDDVIKFLEENNDCDGGISTGNCTCTAIGILEDERDKGDETSG